MEVLRVIMYVSDLIAGICKAYDFMISSDNSIHTSSCNIFHLSTGKPTSLNALKNSIESILNIDLQTNYVDSRSGEVEKNFADFSKAQELLDFNPVYNFDQGLRNMIEWFTSNCIPLNSEK